MAAGEEALVNAKVRESPGARKLEDESASNWMA